MVTWVKLLACLSVEGRLVLCGLLQQSGDESSLPLDHHRESPSGISITTVTIAIARIASDITIQSNH